MPQPYGGNEVVVAAPAPSTLVGDTLADVMARHLAS